VHAPPDGKAHCTLQLLADKLVELQFVETISDVAVMHRLLKIRKMSVISFGATFIRFAATFRYRFVMRYFTYVKHFGEESV